MSLFTFRTPVAPAIEEIKESVYGDAPRVDKEAGIIHGVRILGKESKNGRTYSDSAMRDAARLYEGRKVNVDHPGEKQQERGFTEGIGELRNIRTEGDAIIGDLHYAKSHRDAPLVVEYAERFPKQFGLSHHADGRVSRKGGKVMVESVEVVHSVDIVGSPATNRGLFESVGKTEEGAIVKITLRELVESAGNALFKARLKEMDVGMTDAPIEMEAAESDAKPEDQITAAFRTMVMGVLDDKALDVKGKMAKIKMILDSEEKLINGTKSDTTEPPTDTKVEESFKTVLNEALKPLVESTRKTELRGQCRELIESAGRGVTSERLDLLVAAKDEAARKKLVESWPTDGGRGAAVSKPSVTPVVKLKENERINFKAGLDRN